MKLRTIIAAFAATVAACDVADVPLTAAMPQPQFSSMEEAEAFFEASGYLEKLQATDKAVECYHLAKKISAEDFEGSRDWWELSIYLEYLAISRAIEAHELIAPISEFVEGERFRAVPSLGSPITQRLLVEWSDYLPGLSIGRQIYDSSGAWYEYAMIDAEEWDQRGAKGAEIYAGKGCDVLVGLAKAEFGFEE